MKKRYILNMVVIVSLAIFVSRIYTEPYAAVSAISNRFMKESLSDDIIERYFSKKEDVKKQAEKSIKNTVINDLGYNEWLEYIDYIEVLVYPMDIIGDSKEELIIAMNVSKNTGVVAIYTKENKTYTLSNKIEKLANIKNISVKRNETSDRKFLMIEEFLDESVGAYFTDNFVRIFSKIDNEFKEVFRQSKDYEAFYYEKWIDTSVENPKWFKLTEESKVDYIPDMDKKISLIVSKIISKHQGAGHSKKEIPTKFKKLEESEFEIKYDWSQKYNYFIIGEGKLNGEDVGIIEDSIQTADYLLKLGEKYYKVINKNGEIKYVKEKEIDIKAM